MFELQLTGQEQQNSIELVAETHDLFRAGDIIRHNQVAHQNPALSQAILIHLQHADLPVHLLECLPGGLRIILSL